MSKEITRLTATKMGEELNILPKRGAGAIINKALIAAGYMSSDDTGYHLTEKASYEKDGVVIPFGIEKTRGGKSYILWNEATLKNKLFLKKLEEITSKEDSPKKEKSVKKDNKKTYSKNNSCKYPQKFKDGIKPPFKNDRDFQNKEILRQIAVAEYLEDWDEVEKLKKLVRRPVRTRQGFMVKSLGECMILDELLRNKFIVCYETQLEETPGVVYGDFFMEMDVNGKKYKIMFELWGYENDPKYLSRKEDKIKLYEESGIVLIELNYQDIIYDLDSTFFRTCNAHPVLQELGLTLKEMRRIDALSV